MESIKILEQALNVATKSGCFSIEEVIKINDALNDIKNPKPVQLEGKPKNLQHK